jgi:hypothetical protein
VSEEPSQAHPLDNVVNDYDARLECMDWLLAELEKGREIDSLREEMLANGWVADQAEELLEEARKQTRHLRGAQSREEVAEQVERRYRRSMRAGTTMGRFGGLGMIFGALVHFAQVVGMYAMQFFGRRRNDRWD